MICLAQFITRLASPYLAVHRDDRHWVARGRRFHARTKGVGFNDDRHDNDDEDNDRIVIEGVLGQ